VVGFAVDAKGGATGFAAVGLAGATATAGTAGGVSGGVGGGVAGGIGLTEIAAGSLAVGSVLALSGDTDQTSRRQIVYVTYTRLNDATGEIYSGRTSGYADEAISTILARRMAGQPILNGQGFDPPTLDRVTNEYEAVRGREQQLIDYHGGARSVGGTARNMINGVADLNPRRPDYMAAALANFGPLPDNSPSRFKFGP
jgi:hypothetical protein